ncbi:hypothetical protein BJV82DRAFT_308093 [Fennellomyces sp. T-0311]|nr:hypothetical protein BJV82DRAFT_308093 [Fennellomyces sp. T-0311]
MSEKEKSSNHVSEIAGESSSAKEIVNPNMVPCSVCYKNPVHKTRNKFLQCHACQEKRRRGEANQSKQLEPFSFEKGCKRALASVDGDTDFFTEDRAASAARLIDCKPLSISIKRQRQDPLELFGLFHDSNLELLKSTLKDDSASCTFQFSSAASAIRTPAPPPPEYEDLAKACASSCLPFLLDKLGPLSEMDDSLQQQLNMDFRLSPYLLPAVAKLFTGAILHSPIGAIKLLTVEVYSRHASLDIHCEAGTVVSTLPNDNNTLYARIFCGTLVAADGKGAKRKLMVGTDTINILCICSVLVSATQSVSVGPNTNYNVDSSRTRIYFEIDAIREFQQKQQHITSQNVYEFDLNTLRQLISGFDSPTTYVPYRPTSSPFNDLHHMPATIFTSCDLPSHAGYGTNYTSAPKVASELLQLFARAIVTTSARLPKQQYADFRKKTDSVTTKGTKQWAALSAILVDLDQDFKSKEFIEVYVFIGNHGLQGISEVAGGALAEANKKIQKKHSSTTCAFVWHTRI